MIILPWRRNKFLLRRSDIGDLRLLRVLDISCNAIESLPSRIGLLRRLEVLKCNGNRLFELPNELSSCLLLAELNCSENVLASLPRSLGNIENLHTLLVSGALSAVCSRPDAFFPQVQNNQLESLPPTLANAPLDNINCRNNPRLHQTMIPKQMSDDVDFIVWILRLCRNQEIEMKRISDSTSQLKQLGNFAHQRQAQLSAHLRNSREECPALVRNAPTGLLGKLAAAAKHVRRRSNKA